MKKLLIETEEMVNAKHLYQKIIKLSEQLKEIKNEFSICESDFFKKYDAGAELEDGVPSFTVREYSRNIVQWKKQLEKLEGKEVADEILEKTKPTKYRELIF